MTCYPAWPKVVGVSRGDSALGKIKRPALRYYGGGWSRAAWTVSHFPPHDNYLEPCFGAGSILFHKPKCKLETVNDIDGRVVNFFEVLRERPKDLIELIHLTPWAKDEYLRCLTVSPDALEDARRFFFTCWASIKGGPNAGPADFRWQKKLTRRSSAVTDIVNVGHLHRVAERLKNVQILNMDALSLIEKYVERDVLIYFDPPYVPSSRTNRKGFRFEVDEDWHRRAGGLLRHAAGPVVVSGYSCRLYSEIYEGHGWTCRSKPTTTNSGGKRVESLWFSPKDLVGKFQP